MRSDAGQRIEAASGGTVRNLAGRTDIAAAAALVAGARLVVGVDTGLTHMGVAAGVPTLALFGSTCPYLSRPRPAADRALPRPVLFRPANARPAAAAPIRA